MERAEASYILHAPSVEKKQLLFADIKENGFNNARYTDFFCAFVQIMLKFIKAAILTVVLWHFSILATFSHSEQSHPMTVKEAIILRLTPFVRLLTT